MIVKSAERARRVARNLLPKRAFHSFAGMLDAAYCIRKLGLSDYRRLRSSYPDRCAGDESELSFTFPNLLYPITLRRGTSDSIEVMQTVARELYGHFQPSKPVRFIIDAGSYIGDTAAYYLSKYPEAHVVSVEPDPANFRLASANLKPYGERVSLVQAGVWYRNAKLKVRTVDDKSGISVEETESDSDDYTCEGVSPFTLMERFGRETIDILKCDIEGAEEMLFASDSDRWLSRTRSIFIEIHHQAALDAVLTATSRYSFSHQIYRNIHVFLRD